MNGWPTTQGMRISKNNFIVEVDSQFEKINVPGFDFFLDTDFNPKLLATRIGRIHTLPISVEGFLYDNPLSVGDVVVFNHLVTQNAMRIEGNLFKCPYFNIYAKIVDGLIEPLEDVFFSAPMKEPDFTAGLFHSPGKISGKYAKVICVSKKVLGAGVELNDTIFFSKNADYEMKVGGKDLFKMHLRNVIGIERDGVLKTFGQKMLCEDVTELKFESGLHKIYANTGLRHGVVIDGGASGIEAGTELTFMHGTATRVEWKGKEYSFIGIDNIKYIKTMDGIKARPVSNRILIKQEEGREVIAGGIIIPSSEREKPCSGIVCAVGPGSRDLEGKLIPMETKVGDRVVYSEHTATTVDVDGVDYQCVQEPNLILIY